MTRQSCDRPVCEKPAVTFADDTSTFLCADHAPADSDVTS